MARLRAALLPSPIFDPVAIDPTAINATEEEEAEAFMSIPSRIGSPELSPTDALGPVVIFNPLF